MATFKQGDVIKIPFPYTDRATRQRRRALVISTGDIETAHELLWVLMITSSENRGRPGDVAVPDATRLGKIEARSLRRVLGKVSRELGLSSTS